MLIRSITPITVSDEEITRRQERYERLTPTGLTIVLENIAHTPDSPTELSTPEQVRHSDRISSNMAAATPPQFGAIMPDCVLDTGLEGADRADGIVGLGITRLSAHFLASLGLRFGVITRNQVIGDEYRALLVSYGLSDYLDDIYVLGLEAADITDDAKWNAAITTVAVAAAERGTRILINGCSAVDVDTAVPTVRIIDPTALALTVAALAHNLGLLGGDRA